jgi:hypothetical protein
MAVRLLSLRVVRVKVVRVVRERGNLEPVSVEDVSNRARVERVDVDV